MKSTWKKRTFRVLAVSSTQALYKNIRTPFSVTCQLMLNNLHRFLVKATVNYRRLRWRIHLGLARDPRLDSASFECICSVEVKSSLSLSMCDAKAFPSTSGVQSLPPVTIHFIQIVFRMNDLAFFFYFWYNVIECNFLWVLNFPNKG